MSAPLLTLLDYTLFLLRQLSDFLLLSTWADCNIPATVYGMPIVFQELRVH